MRGVVQITPEGEIEYPFGKPEEKKEPDLNELYRKEIERIRQERPDLLIIETPTIKPNTPAPLVIQRKPKNIKNKDKGAEKKEWPM